jgi:hypothetical protein
MAPRLCTYLLALWALATAPAFGADSGLLSLSNNPFSRPEIFNAPPPPPVRQTVVLPPEQVELNLTATMVSEIAPMVVVDGERLAIGDKIEGLKLIAVREGEAIFTRAGKKFSFTIKDRQSN